MSPGGNPYTNPLQIYAHAREVRRASKRARGGGLLREGAQGLGTRTEEGTARSTLRSARRSLLLPAPLTPHAPHYHPRTQTTTTNTQAEAWSHAKAIGIFQKHPTATVVTAGDVLFPAGRGQAVTQNAQQRGGVARSAAGFAAGNPVTLFGVTAIASTDVGARAFAGERSVPMTPEPGSGYKVAVGNSLRRWDAVPARRGPNRLPNLYEFATAATERAPLSKGVSENGGGPMAHAAAGEAVSMSFADTNDNDRYGAP